MRTVNGMRGWYSPYGHYENDAEVRAVPDLIMSGHFNLGEPGVFDPIINTLLSEGDFYLHLADLRSYSEAQAKLGFYLNLAAWGRTATINIASSGKFSSDRTIAQYASEIWNVSPCPTADISKTAEDPSEWINWRTSGLAMRAT